MIEGTLSVVVWPTYVGVARLGCTPPFSIDEPHNGGYERGTILWTPVSDDRQVIGRARIVCPPGEYTHLVYFRHPTRPQCCGVVQMDHPVVFDRLGVLDLDPIVNNDLNLVRMEC